MNPWVRRSLEATAVASGLVVLGAGMAHASDAPDRATNHDQGDRSGASSTAHRRAGAHAKERSGLVGRLGTGKLGHLVAAAAHGPALPDLSTSATTGWQPSGTPARHVRPAASPRLFDPADPVPSRSGRTHLVAGRTSPAPGELGSHVAPRGDLAASAADAAGPALGGRGGLTHRAGADDAASLPRVTSGVVGEHSAAYPVLDAYTVDDAVSGVLDGLDDATHGRPAHPTVHRTAARDAASPLPGLDAYTVDDSVSGVLDGLDDATHGAGRGRPAHATGGPDVPLPLPTPLGPPSYPGGNGPFPFGPLGQPGVPGTAGAAGADSARSAVGDGPSPEFGWARGTDQSPAPLPLPVPLGPPSYPGGNGPFPFGHLGQPGTPGVVGSDSARSAVGDGPSPEFGWARGTDQSPAPLPLPVPLGPPSYPGGNGPFPFGHLGEPGGPGTIGAGSARSAVAEQPALEFGWAREASLTPEPMPLPTPVGPPVYPTYPVPGVDGGQDLDLAGLDGLASLPNVGDMSDVSRVVHGLGGLADLGLQDL